MKAKFLAIIFMSLMNLTAYSQNGTGTAGPISIINYKVYFVEILNLRFYSDIEALLLKSNCPNLLVDDNKYFILRLENTKNNDNSYILSFELFKTPLIPIDVIGFFKIDSYYFFVSGKVPDNFLFVTKQSDVFMSKMGKYPVVESMPSWYFLFRENQITELIMMDCWE
jgi:hypothetical protein